MKVTHQFVVEWMSPTFEIDVRQVESSHGYNHLIVGAMSSNHLVIIQEFD